MHQRLSQRPCVDAFWNRLFKSLHQIFVSSFFFSTIVFYPSFSRVAIQSGSLFEILLSRDMSREEKLVMKDISQTPATHRTTHCGTVKFFFLASNKSGCSICYCFRWDLNLKFANENVHYNFKLFVNLFYSAVLQFVNKICDATKERKWIAIF